MYWISRSPVFLLCAAVITRKTGSHFYAHISKFVSYMETVYTVFAGLLLWQAGGYSEGMVINLTTQQGC